MPPEGRLWGAERTVLYLPTAASRFDGLDGNREQRIRSKIEQFLENPEAPFDKHPREFVGELKDRGSKMRGFGTWCQNDTLSQELLIVHTIFRKRNEDDYWTEVDDLNAEGRGFAGNFSEMDSDDHDAWLRDRRDDGDYCVVE